MSVSTVGLVMTENKDFLTFKKLILEGISSLFEDAESGTGIVRGCFSGFSDSFQFIFNLKGDERMLTVHFDCDCDGEDVGYLDGSKVILSLGCWGDSLEIMERILKHLNILGKTYILENDYDAELKEVQA